MFLLIAAGALMAVRLQLLFPRSVIVWLTWRSTLLDKVTVTIKVTVTL